MALVAVSALITACTAFVPVYDRAMQQALVDTCWRTGALPR